MNVITPQSDNNFVKDHQITCFLGGGITNCRNWQNEVIDELFNLSKEIDLEDLVIYNPRRQNFDINKIKAENQIKWQFERIEKSNLFSMFFCGDTDSPQPICFFEYGKQLIIRSNCINTLIVTAEKNFSRFEDVYIQTNLMYPQLNIISYQTENPIKSHALNIVNAYKKLQMHRIAECWSFK